MTRACNTAQQTFVTPRRIEFLATVLVVAKRLASATPAKAGCGKTHGIGPKCLKWPGATLRNDAFPPRPALPREHFVACRFPRAPHLEAVHKPIICVGRERSLEPVA